MNIIIDKAFVELPLKAALAAGKKIIEIYNHPDIEIEYKEDNSPLTQADKSANSTILSYLEKTGIPVISEEGNTIKYEDRKNWEWFWLVDPLDGTKEFIKRNGEFTVNIALIKNEKPVLGIIFIPVLNKLYFSYNDQAFMVEKIPDPNDFDLVLKYIEKNRIILPLNYKREYVIIASKSHLSEETLKIIETIKLDHPGAEILNVGSSLKFCYIAEGYADIYPRYERTMEWDTAAGQAIIEASGGKVIKISDNKALEYNKKVLVNPGFIVTNKIC